MTNIPHSLCTFLPITLAGWSWRLRQYFKTAQPRQANPWQSCRHSCPGFHFEPLTNGPLARRSKIGVQLPLRKQLGRLWAIRSSAHFVSHPQTDSRSRGSQGLYAVGRWQMLSFVHLLSPECNHNYKGNKPNVELFHIPKPNCYNHQVITSDAFSSLAYPAGLCPSATTFFLRTALLYSAALWVGLRLLFPGVKCLYLGEYDLDSHLVIFFSSATRKVVIGDWRASLDQNII